MNFLTCTHTDIGTKKKTNQDSMLVMQARTAQGQVLLASVCDGMGGLAKGEVASAAMISALQKWFTKDFPVLLKDGFTETGLQAQWRELVKSTGQRIMDYGVGFHAELGTTCVALLIVGNQYYLMNVGDSRVYLFTDNAYLLTKDQTVIQREIDEGRLTYEEALVHPNRGMLLQCIGASRYVDPVFGKGSTQEGQCFMLCSDGFRHVITPQEFLDAFYPPYLTSYETMKQRLEVLTRLNLQRRETDNISAILIKTY